MRSGGWLGVGNDSNYNHSDCFAKFPFPDPDEATKQKIRELGEQLDAHRKGRQELHPGLTMTGMYNVLEKLRAGEALTEKEQTIHEQGLVSVLKEIHDRLDEAVSDAYGWPRDLGEEEILGRLVDLNAERAAEEAKGLVRYLRPEFQNPEGTKTKPVQKDLGITPEEKAAAKATAKSKPKKQPWPKSLSERFQAVRTGAGTIPDAFVPRRLRQAFHAGQNRHRERTVGNARRFGPGPPNGRRPLRAALKWSESDWPHSPGGSCSCKMKHTDCQKLRHATFPQNRLTNPPR